MQMPGRTVTSSAYRYGFNGKENDYDVKGNGNQQDYGMRIYDPRLGRFHSPDPLGSKFANLTPYQFASNRPIDGMDIDGMEYVTYIVNIYQNKNGSAFQTINYKWFNELQHNKCGELGRVVTYDIRVHTSSGAAFQLTPFFVKREAKVLGVYQNDYGNYMGSTSLYEVNTNINTKHFDKSKILRNKYNYDLPAVDHVDNLARVHDQRYDAIDAKGSASLTSDWGATPADIEALRGWQSFLNDTYSNKNNGVDPFNNLAITAGERRAALRGSTLFDKIVSDKLSAISKFMQKNFKSEASNDKDENYQLFLGKYMHQDENGNWRRNEGKWTKQENEVYTPNKPSK